LQHLLWRDIARLQLGHLFARHRDIARRVAQQHTHVGFLLQRLTSQYQASALGHGVAAVDVHKQAFGLRRARHQ
jgi:hypothetical protein